MRIKNVNKIIEDDDYEFTIQHGVHSEIICKWIMDSEAIKYMTSHRTAFDMYKVIALRNVFERW